MTIDDVLDLAKQHYPYWTVELCVCDVARKRIRAVPPVWQLQIYRCPLEAAHNGPLTASSAGIALGLGRGEAAAIMYAADDHQQRATELGFPGLRARMLQHFGLDAEP